MLGQKIGKPLHVLSGNRTREEQEALYAKYLNGTGNLAARPGTSNHEDGKAADVYVGKGGPALQTVAGKEAEALGLGFPVGGEPWHVENVSGTKAPNAELTVAAKPTGSVTVKGQAASADQQKVLHDVIATTVSESKKKGLSQADSRRAAQIAVMTVTQESSTSNLNHGDRLSLGAFQQRPDSGWGNPGSVVQDTKDFVNGVGSNKGLFDTMKENKGAALTVLAQTVQKSGLPDAYAQWEKESKKTVDSYLGGSGSSAAQSSDTSSTTTAGTSSAPASAGAPASSGSAPAASSGSAGSGARPGGASSGDSGSGGGSRSKPTPPAPSGSRPRPGGATPDVATPEPDAVDEPIGEPADDSAVVPDTPVSTEPNALAQSVVDKLSAAMLVDPAFMWQLFASLGYPDLSTEAGRQQLAAAALPYSQAGQASAAPAAAQPVAAQPVVAQPVDAMPTAAVQAAYATYAQPAA